MAALPPRAVTISKHTHTTHTAVLESKFLHQQVNSGVHLKAMQVVCVPLKSHQQATIRHIRRAKEQENKGKVYVSCV